MQNDTFANRLRKALNINNMTQSQLAEKSGLDKSLISNYLSGNYKARQDKISLLAKVLNVNEAWLMGYDIYETAEPCADYASPSCEILDSKPLDEFDILFSKYKNVLSNDDKDMIKFIIEKRKKEIDEQNN